MTMDMAEIILIRNRGQLSRRLLAGGTIELSYIGWYTDPTCERKKNVKPLVSRAIGLGRLIQRLHATAAPHRQSQVVRRGLALKGRGAFLTRRAGGSDR